MTGERAAIFGQFIEQLVESDVAVSDREQVYKVLLEILEDFEIKGMDGYLDIDPAFDEVWNEKYPPEIEEYEE
jgi:hypothetical protein